jgi:hypothetical protein
MKRVQLFIAGSFFQIDCLTFCGLIHSRNKFYVRNLVKLSIAENLLSAGLMNENPLKAYTLQHWIYSGLAAGIFQDFNYYLVQLNEFILTPL